MATLILSPTMADAKQELNNGSSGSRLVLAKPRLGGFGSSSFGASSSAKISNSSSSILRQPQLIPSSNPFLKLSANDSKSDTENEAKVDEKPIESKAKEVAPKFVPLGATNIPTRSTNSVPAPIQPAANVPPSGFVFGQNLSERVVIKESINNGEASSSENHSCSNGATDLLFSRAAANVRDNGQEDCLEATSTASSTDRLNLADAAAEYERSHARPPPPAEAHTLTGEEGEINVLQISCRLFAWEDGSWHERGRGVLRLNDAAEGAGAGPEGEGSRVVVRVAGSLRVVLNTKLWPAMVLQRAGARSLRLSAMDAHQQVKLFLIMGAPGDIHQLYHELTSRIAVSKNINNGQQNSTSQQAAERLEGSANDLDQPASDFDQDYSDKRLDDESDLNTQPQAQDDDLDNQSKSLKRKEITKDELSPKRQCPETSVE